MLDSDEIYALGLRFAHSLQASLRSLTTFAPEHQSAQKPVQQSFDFLNDLLKKQGQFTLGFRDNHVVLNDLLTVESSLAPLEKEFLKRGIGAVIFTPGLTVTRFKRLIGILSSPTHAPETSGAPEQPAHEEIDGIQIVPLASQSKEKDAPSIADPPDEPGALAGEEPTRDPAELAWLGQSNPDKFAHLMEISRYTPAEFGRLVEFLKTLVLGRELGQATDLATHYFEFLDEDELRIRREEIDRAAELVRTVSVARVNYVVPTVERLGHTLIREDVADGVHAAAAGILSTLSQAIVHFEEFAEVFAIGRVLDQSRKRNPALHQRCCGDALNRMLPATTVERIIEIYLVRRDDSAWAKMAAGMLRFGAPASIEKVFAHLIDEKDARSRIAILRLIGMLRLEALDVARKHLHDGRWYVVRNMCNLLAQIEDPDLAQHIGPALQHPDARVQEAAFNATIKGRGPGRSAVLANSLSGMAPSVMEKALDELMFMKDPESVPGLVDLVAAKTANRELINRVIQIISSMPGAGARQGLEGIFRINTLDFATRRAALRLIARDPSPEAAGLLADLSHMHDPLAIEARKSLETRKV